MMRAIKGSQSTNSSRRPDEGPSFHARGTSNRAEIKKAVPMEIGTASYCLLTCLALRLLADACSASRRFKPPLASIVPDNAPAK
ncbi:hypothetical protein B0G71_2526 [Paraburkholderia sp. BL27I4N3]|nr:hypothetical protein B0G71_2526 [Paraburkholderia sp. BL27I4N3]